MKTKQVKVEDERLMFPKTKKLTAISVSTGVLLLRFCIGEILMAANKPGSAVLADEACPPLNTEYCVNFLFVTDYILYLYKRVSFEFLIQHVFISL